MIDKEVLKTLYKQFSGCKWMEVGIDGKINKSVDIFIKFVCINKDGNVAMYFRKGNPYDEMMHAGVDAVTWSYDDCIKGLFTSEEKAAAVTKEHFKDIKKNRIAELEAELASLKNSL